MSQPGIQRRRSERVSKSLPLVVRGVDLLGQPFEERTSTLALNLHGCRYSSKHHLPKNTWITLELAQGVDRRSVRARVAWIQRPHSVRELFQIAAELESPANIWDVASPPGDWKTAGNSSQVTADDATHRENPHFSRKYGSSTAAANLETSPEGSIADMTNMPANLASTAQSLDGLGSVPSAENPLLREWSADIERQASRAVEVAAAEAVGQIRSTIEEIERTQASTRENFSRQLAAKQEEFISALKLEFEQGFQQARDLLIELDRKAEALRSEGQAMAESASQMAQTRLETEAAVRAQHPSKEALQNPVTSDEDAAAVWRHRIQTEMALAQAQWNELLQSSLDGSLQRLAGQLTERSQGVLHNAEQILSERFAEIREPLGQLSAEARETFSDVKASLAQEVAHARSSLAEIEHSASKIKDYSGQLESAAHDTLNELHRRMQNSLEEQSDQMNRRADSLIAAMPERLGPALDSMSQQFIERAVEEVESRLAPRIERIPELLRELGAREAQADESLRLHRERLRQIAENSQRETASQMAETLSHLRGDFESARVAALAKWNEELDACGVRASHAAADSIGRSSDWLQQEARVRLQVLAEQILDTAGSTFEQKATEVSRQAESRLDEQSAVRLAQTKQQLEDLFTEVAGRTRTQFDEAAESAAASFGQVIRSASEQEAMEFAETSRNSLREQEQTLDMFTKELFRNFEASAGTAVERFRAQVTSQLEAAVSDGRGALAAEFASALSGYRTELGAHQNEWVGKIDRVGDEAAVKYQDRLQNTCDAWMVSSVRRLSEHGQNVLESLMRSANQALRESCSEVFEGLAKTLQNGAGNTPGISGFTVASSAEADGSAESQRQPISKSSNA